MRLVIREEALDDLDGVPFLYDRPRDPPDWRVCRSVTGRQRNANVNLVACSTQFVFEDFGGRKVVAGFDGGSITPNAAVFLHRPGGSEDSCAAFLAVMRVPVVDVVLELDCELMDFVGLAGNRGHVRHSGSSWPYV